MMWYKKLKKLSHSHLRDLLVLCGALTVLVLAAVFISEGGMSAPAKALALFARQNPFTQGASYLSCTFGDCGSSLSQVWGMRQDSDYVNPGTSVTLTWYAYSISTTEGGLFSHSHTNYYPWCTAGCGFATWAAVNPTVGNLTSGALIGTVVVNPTVTTTYYFCQQATGACTGVQVNVVQPPSPANCTNGATNPPTCNACSSGYIYNGSACVTPPAQPSSALTIDCDGYNLVPCAGSTNNAGEVLVGTPITVRAGFTAAPGDTLAARAIVGSFPAITQPDSWPAYEYARVDDSGTSLTYTFTPTHTGGWQFYAIEATGYYPWNSYNAWSNYDTWGWAVALNPCTNGLDSNTYAPEGCRCPSGQYQPTGSSVCVNNAISVTASGSPGEPATTGTYTITATGATTTPVGINFTMSGTATRCTTSLTPSSCPAGTDYVLTGGGITSGSDTAVILPANATSVTVTLTPVNDAVAESAETAVMKIAGNATLSLGSPSAATSTIADDDNAQSCTLSPSATTVSSGSNVTINYTTTGSPSSLVIKDGATTLTTISSPSASGTYTYTAPSTGSHTLSGMVGSFTCTGGSNGLTFTVNPLCSQASGGGAVGTYPSCTCNTSGYVYNSSGSGSCAPPSTPPTCSATFSTPVISGAPSTATYSYANTTSVYFSYSNPSGDSESPSTNPSTPVSPTGSTQTANLINSNSVNSTITVSMYAMGPGGGPTLCASQGVIVNPGASSPTITMTISPWYITEGSTAATLTINNNGASTVNNVGYLLSNGSGATCGAGGDYSLSGAITSCSTSGTLASVPPGNTTVTITPGNTTFSGTRSLTVSPTSGSGYTVGSSAFLDIYPPVSSGAVTITASPSSNSIGALESVQISKADGISDILLTCNDEDADSSDYCNEKYLDVAYVSTANESSYNLTIPDVTGTINYVLFDGNTGRWLGKSNPVVVSEGTDICTDIGGTQTTPPDGCISPDTPPGACIPPGYSWTGTSCVPSDASVTNFYSSPPRVRKGGTTNLHWVGTGLPAECILTYNGTQHYVSSSATTGTYPISGITQNTFFTLACGDSPVWSTNVLLLPTVQEI